MKTTKKAQKVLKFKFHRICRLEECEISFDTNRKEHYFCCTEHQQEYWKRIRCGDRTIIAEVSRQGKEIEKIKAKLDRLS